MEKKNEQTVELSKDFNVPVEELYKAWISPDALKQWWNPMGKKLTDITNEVRKGGRINYTANDSETPLVIKGEYEEVKENEKLVYTWDFNFSNDAFKESTFRLTINFREQGNGSRLEVAQENLKDHEAVKVHEKGWKQQLEKLQDYLES